MKAVIDILTNDSSLTTLIGADKVFSSYAPQEQQKPHVIVMSSVDDPHTTMSGQNLDELSVRVWSISNWEYTNGSNIGAWDISQAVRSALHGVTGTHASQVVDINYESDGIIRVNDPNNPSIEVEQVYQVFNRR